jgi:Haem-degrading
MLSIKLKLKKLSKQLQLRLEHHVTIQYRCRRPEHYLGTFLRMGNAWPGSLDVAMKKAKAVALFNGHSPLHNCKCYSPRRRTVWAGETNGGLVIFGGGLPLL